MPQRMAAERVARKQQCIGRQYQAADADAEMSGASAIGEPERRDRIKRQDTNEEDADIKKIPMHVLQDQREGSLAEIRLARLAYRAGERVGPERFIVGAAIVVAREPESARCP